MPLAAYFWKVGAALLALLFFADYWLPRAAFPEQATGDRPAIHIHSDQKWPERIVFDTSPVIVTAAPVAEIAKVATSSGVTEPPATRTDKPANAFAMLGHSDTRPPESVDRKRQRKTSHVAARPRRQVKSQMMLAAQQGQFGWFGFRSW